MKIQKRNHCIINDNESINSIYSFKKFPVLMNCIDISDTSADSFLDMEWGCSETGHLQLITLLDPDIIYSNYHSTGLHGKTWTDHHRKLFEFIDRDNYSNVLEIGGSSGMLSNHFCQTDKQFQWSMIEPSLKVLHKDSRLNLIQGYFENHNFQRKFDTIVHSHCIEHAYNPVDFLNKINSLLDYGDHQYISIPNMKYWLENNFTNTLSFEHTFYVDELVLKYLLNKTGFIVVDKIVENHSIFVKAVKAQDVKIPATDFSYIKKMFMNYVDNLQNDATNISNAVKDQKFYLFGAHMFSLMLFNLGLDQSNVISILDNDQNKQNKRMYGTNSIVHSPKILQGLDSPVVVLRGGVYTGEIKESILKINPTTIIV